MNYFFNPQSKIRSLALEFCSPFIQIKLVKIFMEFTEKTLSFLNSDHIFNTLVNLTYQQQERFYFAMHNNKIHTIYKQTSFFVLIFSMLLFWCHKQSSNNRKSSIYIRSQCAMGLEFDVLSTRLPHIENSPFFFGVEILKGKFCVF
jgi:hypothetical protein